MDERAWSTLDYTSLLLYWVHQKILIDDEELSNHFACGASDAPAFKWGVFPILSRPRDLFGHLTLRHLTLRHLTRAAVESLKVESQASKVWGLWYL